jgi:DivIVA domain-containing protein
MIDDTFHLTPLDVRRYEFGKALRGYDPERVNQFRDQVAEELERLSRVNQELEAKARGFHEQLRAFRERDKAINEALVSAQQLRKDIREQADKESQLIIREARAEADRIIEDSRQEVRRIEDQITSLDRARRAYLAQLRMVVERQLAEISAAEHASNPSVQPAVKEAIEHAAELGSNPVSSRAAPSAPSAPPAPKAAASAAAASAAVPLAEAAERRPAEAAPSWYESLIKE